jgi:hypothetical protein
MAETKNYLLGYGERLTERLDPPRLRPSKKDPYTFERAKTRLTPRISAVASDIASLPAAACPNEQSVAVLTLHPTYLAKSYFPRGLLRTVGLEAIGSRAHSVIPEVGAKEKKKKSESKPAHGQDEAIPVTASPTAEIFVAGSRANFRLWASALKYWTETSDSGTAELVRIEGVYVPQPKDRLKGIRPRLEAPLLELVLHAPDDFVIEGFRKYMRSLDVSVNLDKRFQVEGLCFLAARVPKEAHLEMAKYSFLRVAREMPRLRDLSPGLPIRSFGVGGFPCELPDVDALNPELRVAVFDGGIPSDSHLDRWVSRKKAAKLGPAAPEGLSHGLGVTSAVLFGSLDQDRPLPRPFAPVDHYRVIDEGSHDPAGDYYDVLERITSILSQKKYDFINLSSVCVMSSASPRSRRSLMAMLNTSRWYRRNNTAKASPSPCFRRTKTSSSTSALSWM